MKPRGDGYTAQTPLLPRMNIKLGTFDHSIFHIDILDQATRIFCRSTILKCTLMPFRDVNYGDIDDNGTATYRVRDILDGHIDTFLPVFTPTYRRFQGIDFSQPVFYSDILLITRAPTEPKRVFDPTLFTVVPWRVWCFLIASLVVVSCLISFLIRAKNQLDHVPKFCWVVSTVCRFSSLITQEYDKKFLSSNSNRLVVTSWALATMVISASYTGMLFSENLKPIDPLPYDDFESFITCLEEARCRWITASTTSSIFQTLVAPESAFGRRVFATFEKRPPIIMNTAYILDTIYREQDTYFVWMSSRSLFGTYYKSIDGCPVYVMETSYKEVWAFPFRKGSPLKEHLNRAVAAFTELGLGQVLSGKELGLTRCNQNHFRSGRKSGDNSMIITAICSFGAAMVLNIFAFMVEIVRN